MAALEGGGLQTDKISRVVGLSSSVLFDKDNPRNPINRRISIIVMTKEADESALKTDAMPANAPAPMGAGADGLGVGGPVQLSVPPAPPPAPAPPSAPAGAAAADGATPSPK